MAWLHWRQSGVLADRYLDTLLGDLRHSLLLLLQSPVIASLILIVWRNVEEVTLTLYFVLTLTSIWFGCSNAAREIVKERAIFFRERMIGIDIPAYVFSKTRILAMLGFLQCLILLLVVNYGVHLLGNKLLLFLNLYCCSLAGTMLGLCVSAFMNSQDKAVGMVPLLVIPQILFSEFVLPETLHQGTSKVLQHFMFAGWGYSGFKEIIAPEPSWGIVLRNCGVLLGFGAVFFWLTIMILQRKRPS